MKHRLNDLTNVLHRPVETAAQRGLKIMKSLIFRACSAILLFLVYSGANAAEVVVIANPRISISGGDIKDIFLGEKQFAGSTKLVVIDNASAQGAFLSKFM